MGKHLYVGQAKACFGAILRESLRELLAVVGARWRIHFRHPVSDARACRIRIGLPPDENATGKEAELLSDAYYTAAKAKRQGLGLVQFIGELFKLNMLIEKIMYSLMKIITDIKV